MVDNKYSPNNYEHLKISIGTIIKDPEMLRFIPYHLNPNLGARGRVGGGGWGGVILPQPMLACWFSLNNSETIKTVTLTFCSI